MCHPKRCRHGGRQRLRAHPWILIWASGLRRHVRVLVVFDPREVAAFVLFGSKAKSNQDQ
jgi:hypothetical protein